MKSTSIPAIQAPALSGEGCLVHYRPWSRDRDQGPASGPWGMVWEPDGGSKSGCSWAGG